MRIYALLSAPDPSLVFDSRPSILCHLLNRCKSMCVATKDTIIVYDYCLLDEKPILAENEQYIKDRSKIIREMHDITEKDVFDIVSKNIEGSTNYGPLTLLFFLESTEDRCIRKLAIHIIRTIEKMSGKDSDLIRLYGSLHEESPRVVEKKPSPHSVRVLMRELSSLCTRYSLSSLSHVCVAFLCVS